MVTMLTIKYENMCIEKYDYFFQIWASIILSQLFVVVFGATKYFEQFYPQLAYHFMDLGNRVDKIQ